MKQRSFGQMLAFLLAGCLLLFLTGCGGYSEKDLEQARSDGFQNGYRSGFQQGFETGAEQNTGLYDQGFSAGRQTGFSEGEEQALQSAGDSFAKGYEQGFGEGEAGQTRQTEQAREDYLSGLQTAHTIPLIGSGEVTSAPDRSVPDASSQQEPTEKTVYVTKSGKKYHRADCVHLSKSKIEKTLSEAQAAGYSPCSQCNPPQ